MTNFNIEVDIHTHTVASTHAYSTVHDYVIHAKRKGLKMFAVTDHGPEMEDAPHEWHFQNSLLFPRWDDGIGILRGIESNIKNLDGEIDCSKKVRDSLDIVLGGFHKQVFAPQTKAIHTEAMINAIASGEVHAITHPGNPAFPIDHKAVVLAAAKHNVALEVNNSSFVYSRKGSVETCGEIITLAKRFDAPLSVGSDSHIAYNVGNFEKSLAMINAAQYPTERIINRTITSLFEYLTSKGRPQIRTDFE